MVVSKRRLRLFSGWKDAGSVRSLLRLRSSSGGAVLLFLIIGFDGQPLFVPARNTRLETVVSRRRRWKSRLQSARGSLGLDLVEVGVIRVDLSRVLGRERHLRDLELW